MIDTAPLFLGLFAYLAGSKQEQIQVISKNNEKIRFRYVEKIAKFGICERDLQTLEGKWSEGYCKIFGLPARDQAPPLETHLKFIHKDDRARVQAHYIEILSGRQRNSRSNFASYLKMALSVGSKNMVLPSHPKKKTTPDSLALSKILQLLHSLKKKFDFTKLR